MNENNYESIYKENERERERKTAVGGRSASLRLKSWTSDPGILFGLGQVVQ